MKSKKTAISIFIEYKKIESQRGRLEKTNIGISV